MPVSDKREFQRRIYSELRGRGLSKPDALALVLDCLKGTHSWVVGRPDQPMWCDACGVIAPLETARDSMVEDLLRIKKDLE